MNQNKEPEEKIKKDYIVTTLRIEKSDYEKLKRLGLGNLSAGLRMLFYISRVPLRRALEQFDNDKMENDK